VVGADGGGGRDLSRLLVEGVAALPCFGGGEADLPRVGAGLSRIEDDLPLTEEALSWVSARVLLRVKTGGRPLGVSDEWVGLAGDVPAGSSTLTGAGVGSLEVGAEPEAVRFLPARQVGGGLAMLAEPSASVHLSPRLEAVAMKYLALLFLASTAISASKAVARLSSSLAFQLSHFSSTSAAAALVAFSLNFSFVWAYQSW
jgi:hypothetical protein